MQKYYTYAHYTKDTNKLFYIGKGTTQTRHKFQRASDRAGRNLHWKRVEKKYGGFTYEILSLWKTEEEAFQHEKLLISIFKDQLTNMTVGGEGCHGRKHSEEEKRKRASSLRGKKRTAITLKRMSEAQKKNIAAIQVIQRANERKKKKTLCVETGIVYESLKKAGEQTGIPFKNISKVCKGERRTAGGYSWKYLNDNS